jgi:hypothetical protein
MKIFSFSLAGITLFILSLALSACGPQVTVNQVQSQPTVVIDKSFQQKLTSMPAVPEYRCGAWASTNAPNPYSDITIYARLMNKDIQGVSGAKAQATVHFKSGDVTLDTQPVSDTGGYVTFQVPLQGRQPTLAAATIDITFAINGKSVQCTPAFFTPQ